jgi:hypothetical protein
MPCLTHAQRDDEARDRAAIEKLSGEAMVRRFATVWQAKEDDADAMR